MFDESGIVNPKRTNQTFVPLSPEEFPEKGSLVALDAEFVSLDQVKFVFLFEYWKMILKD